MTRHRSSHALLLFVALSEAACVPSNVVAATDRSVVVEAERAAWSPASAAELPGLYRSGPMTGALATALIQLHYLFLADGRFTGAALFAGPPTEFQVLSGRWEFDATGKLILDGGDPADLESAAGMLRITGADGSVVLYREAAR